MRWHPNYPAGIFGGVEMGEEQVIDSRKAGVRRSRRRPAFEERSEGAEAVGDKCIAWLSTEGGLIQSPGLSSPNIIHP